MTDEKNEQPQDPQELARRVMVTSAHFAAASMERYGKEYPDQLEALASTGCTFTVRVDDLLSATPRVSLVGVGNGREIEIAHAELSRVGGPGAVRH